MTDENGLIRFNIKDGEEELLEKMPKGARLVIVEHNVHYDTTVDGRIGVGEYESEEPLNAEETQSDLDADTTETYSFTIPETGATVNFFNDKTVEQIIALRKVGYDNISSRTWDLKGAVFRIYNDPEKKNIVELDEKTEFESGEDGEIYIGRLGAGTYYIDEVIVPEGYIALPGMLVLQVTEEGVTLSSTEAIGTPDLNDWIEASEDEYTVSIRNTTGAVLPSTGGAGTVWFYLAGVLLMIAAGAGMILRQTLRKAKL